MDKNCTELVPNIRFIFIFMGKLILFCRFGRILIKLIEMNTPIFFVAAMLYGLTLSFQNNPTSSTRPGSNGFFCQPIGKGIWVEKLRAFREALYQQDKEKVKTFINFTELNKTHDLWYFVYGYEQANIRPFTVQDFDKNFDKLFSPWLIKCLLKVKTDILHKNGRFETVELNDPSEKTTYRLIATHEKSKNTLELNLNSNTEFKDADGTILDGGEHSIIYIFAITQQGQLQLKRLLVAG